MPDRFPSIAVLFAAAGVIALACSGCVERKMTIKSDPPGAVVWLDGEHLGEAPVTINFEQYGGRDVTLSKPGYHRYRELIEVKPPFYQRLGPDYFFEHLWPGTLVDHQTFTLAMSPLPYLDPAEPIDTESLERGEQALKDRIEDFKEQHAP